MISSKNLADAIYQISLSSKKDSSVISEAIFSYVKNYRLEFLLPKAIVYLEDKIKKESIWNTFFLESRFTLSGEIVKNIKNKLNATDAQEVVIKENTDLIGGFMATYKGIIYDASIKNQLQLLKNSLIK